MLYTLLLSYIKELYKPILLATLNNTQERATKSLLDDYQFWQEWHYDRLSRKHAICQIRSYLTHFNFMGNAQHDARQIKAFNIIKNIPVVSQIYRLPRVIIYNAKGNQEQVQRSAEYKVENLNPLKCVGNIARGFAALSADLDKGIWIGKRPLGGSPLGLTFSPGTDFMHWAVMINHEIYEVTGGDSEDFCKYNTSTCDKLRQEFHWYATDLKPKCSKQSINRKVNRQQARKRKYNLGAVFNGEEENCQTFVIRLLRIVCGVSESYLASQLIICADGTWVI